MLRPTAFFPDGCQAFGDEMMHKVSRGAKGRHGVPLDFCTASLLLEREPRGKAFPATAVHLPTYRYCGVA